MTTTIHSVLERHKAVEQAAAVRRDLLARGYTPLPAVQKQVFMKGWPVVQPTEDDIAEWSRNLDWRTTAFRVEGELVAIDIDVNDYDVAGQLIELLADINDDVVQNAPMRYGSGYKVMLLCRCPGEKVGIVRSKMMIDGEGGKQQVEVYGSNTTHYFTIYGPHTEGRTTAEGVEVKVMYEWEGDRGPRNTDIADLPVITREELVSFCLRSTELMEDHGWTPAPKSQDGEVTERKLADLTPDMKFDLESGITIPFEELEDYRGQRCSAKWQDGLPGHSKSRCMIDVDPVDNIVRILDFSDYTWHYPEGHDVSPKRVRDDAKQKSAAGALGALLADMMDKEDISFTSPASPAAAVEDIDGRELSGWEFVDWLISRYAYFPSGSSAERVIDVVDGTAYPLEGFHGMWVAKAWDEDSGEVYSKGPREGESKTVRVVPTKTWFNDSGRLTIRGYRFDPTTETRLIEDNGLRLNLYRAPGEIEEEAIPEAAAWFEDFLDHLLPEPEECDWFINWLTYKYANPAARGQGVILVSPTGDAGRGVLFRILGEVFENHVANPSASDLTGGGSGQAVFNGWIENTTLALVDELLAEGGSSYHDKRRAYEALKDNVDPLPKAITVNEKGRAKRPAISHVSLISATNHVTALPLPRSDRRFTVLSNGDKLTSRPDLLAAYDGFQDAIGLYKRGFVRAIREWLLAGEGDRETFMQPLMTDAKLEMIGGAESKIDKMLRRVLEGYNHKGRFAVHIHEIVAQVEMEAKAEGYALNVVSMVEEAVKGKLREGFEDWEYPRKLMRVSTDPLVTAVRSVVLQRVTSRGKTVEDREASLHSSH